LCEGRGGNGGRGGNAGISEDIEVYVKDDDTDLLLLVNNLDERAPKGGEGGEFGLGGSAGIFSYKIIYTNDNNYDFLKVKAVLVVLSTGTQ
jgi:hypothetical protein